MRSSSQVKSGGRISSWSLSISSAPATSWSSSPSVSAPNSTSSAAEVGGSSSQSCGAPAMFWAATIRAGATINSTAVAPDRTRAGTGSVADSMPSKCSHETVVLGGWGTVSKTASAMNASVPSEPIRRRRKIWTGSSSSRKAQSL